MVSSGRSSNQHLILDTEDSDTLFTSYEYFLAQLSLLLGWSVILNILTRQYVQ